ncbi:Sterol uptake control protein 2 [Cladobotryum mycophilum]|uniref:Sterol uptake control protein 2 n=1 Tax=Cladobotryum mycophilum TaxID=491253 RepID=A0ABR0S6Y2_9HYPO
MDRGSDSEVTSSSKESTSPSDNAERQGSRSLARRRPIPRKGHTKSRAGCSTCKRRKVKCDETKPECGPCLRLGLHCAYNTQQLRDDDSGDSSTSTVLGRALRTDPLQFDMDDMRFFHHFLFAAYPSLPIDGWQVWQYVSQMSHQYGFLVHAMLGLGASHLTLMSPKNYSQASLYHRVTAIRSLNDFLSHAHMSQANADVAFATMLALTFQASHMPDGMIEFLTMVRGCYLVGLHAMSNYEMSVFKSFERQFYVAKVMELVEIDETNSYLDQLISDQFCVSAKRLAPLCGSIVEIEYLAMMQRIVSTAVIDPANSYTDHTKMYDKLGELSADEFAAFVDPKNHTCRLVIIHMLAVDFIMSRRLPLEGSRVQYFVGLHMGHDFRKAMSVLWIEDTMKALPDEYVQYGQWVLDFVQEYMNTTKMDGIVWRPTMRMQFMQGEVSPNFALIEPGP